MQNPKLAQHSIHVASFFFSVMVLDDCRGIVWEELLDGHCAKTSLMKRSALFFWSTILLWLPLCCGGVVRHGFSMERGQGYRWPDYI